MNNFTKRQNKDPGKGTESSGEIPSKSLSGQGQTAGLGAMTGMCSQNHYLSGQCDHRRDRSAGDHQQQDSKQ